MENSKKNNWKIWEQVPEYGEALYYKSAVGELGEMESAKALCKIISPFYKPGMKVLDVGCGVGHYLRSLRLRVDKEIDYTGLDSTEYFVELAKKAFGQDNKFLVGDIFNLQFEDNAFDIVMCNNVILHLPPPPLKAVSELVRIAKKYVIIRTVLGQRNYLIKEVRTPNEKIKNHPENYRTLINEDGEPSLYNFFNIYSEKYLKEIIFGLDRDIKIEIIDDNDWQAFDNREQGGETGTRVIDAKQVSGNLILDWKFIIIEKP